jgi:hypothetical protein
MPKLIWIRELNPNTWLHWSSKGNASCLRDYRTSPPTEDRTYTTTEVGALLNKPGAIATEADRIPVTNEVAWRRILSRHNLESSLTPIPEMEEVDLDAQGVEVSVSKRDPSLVARFQEEVAPLLLHNRPAELAALLRNWGERFSCIKEKTDIFNHWDHDDATSKISSGSGIGWTSVMLEHCRTDGRANFISVPDEDLSFALVCMELNLGISKHDNLFRDAEGDSVKPDGIGVRSDSSFCVLEVKGPQDEHDWCKATLQALCGALALHAKREMIVKLASKPAGRRPALRSARIPDSERSLGLYVIMSAWPPASPDDELERRMGMLLEACPIVREIAHFTIDHHVDDQLTSLPRPKVYRYQ